MKLFHEIHDMDTATLDLQSGGKVSRSLCDGPWEGTGHVQHCVDKPGWNSDGKNEHGRTIPIICKAEFPPFPVRVL